MNEESIYWFRASFFGQNYILVWYNIHSFSSDFRNNITERVSDLHSRSILVLGADRATQAKQEFIGGQFFQAIPVTFDFIIAE